MEGSNPKGKGILYEIPYSSIGVNLKKIQYVSKYIALSEEGLVSKIECPLDQGLLFANLDMQDVVYLYCLSCSYKKTIGLDYYNQIKMEVDKVNGK